MKNDEQKARYSKWQGIIKEQEASGLSQIDFCKRKGLLSAQFGYYRNRIKQKEGVSKSSFIPITIKQQTAAKDIRLILPNGFQCMFPSDLSASHIKELVKILLSC